ncbi:MAG TPA: ferric reductase-like transmembrane domain-containing protein [Dehalococcoidia bacterium]|nr:ferric reductase-like transmembrane domain-containing protein [Dehalococcoidia bacterium]
MTTSEDLLEGAAPSPIQLLAPIAALVFVAAVVGSGAGSQTVWYIIRATGILAFVILTLSVCVGLLISGRAVPAGRPRVDLYELHTFLSLLALGFVGAHALTLLLDNFVSFSPVQILVPFTSNYRPFAVALGIVGLYLTAVVYASFWARGRIGYKRWRTLHYISFATFGIVALHGMLSGADASAPWMVLVYFLSIAAVVALTANRILSPPATRRARA